MSTAPRLTSTSYGVLGLLAVRPHSTYELAKSMDRSVGRVWPRARSKLYEEPRKLVAHWYATARKESVGRRPRTVYTVTTAGRRALTTWLAEPGDGPALEFEGLVKLLFAGFGDRDAALQSIARARSWAVEMNEGNIEAAERYAAGTRYEEGRGTTVLVGAFLTDFYALVAEWSDWATDLVSTWPDDVSQARVDLSLTREVLARARWSEAEDRRA